MALPGAPLSSSSPASPRLSLGNDVTPARIKGEAAVVWEQWELSSLMDAFNVILVHAELRLHNKLLRCIMWIWEFTQCPVY